MKNCKKILLLLIIAVVIASTTNVYAKDDKKLSSNYKASCVTTNTSNNVRVYYGVTYEIGQGRGQYYLTAKRGTFKIAAIEEGNYDGANNKFTSTGAVVSLKGYVGNYVNNNNALIIGSETTGTGKAKKVEINAKSFTNLASVPSGQDHVLRITVVPAVSDEKCQSPEDYKAAELTNADRGTYVEYIYIMLKNFEANEVPKVHNENYKLAACQTIRNAAAGTLVNVNNVLDANAFNNLVKVGDTHFYEKVAKYQSLVPFCFSSADVVQNFTDAQVKTMVQTAIQSAYAIYLPQTITKDMDWVTSEQRACQAAGGTWTGWGQCSKTGETWQILNEGEEARATSGLYCKYEWQHLGKQVFADSYVNEVNGYKYTNINSYYAKTSKSSTEYYTYQYSDGQDRETDGQANTCTRVCEEVVDVEYGPPQAAIAGFCIEYQVRVTSHVKCTTSLDIHSPNPGTMCVPTPECVHKWGTVSQGGPSEEFDACVQKCDGGKYSDTCSKKCYNEVYKSTAKSKKLDLENKTAVVEFMATSKDQIPTGGYYERQKNSNGGYTIVWVSTGDKKTSKSKPNYGYGTYAEWYLINEEARTIADHGKYFADGTGFKRQHVGDKGACNGDCTHKDCPDNTYLRQEKLNSDYEQNIALYNKIVNECAAQATCTEATATFTIEADVRTNGTKQTIKFPMKKSEDTLHSSPNGEDRSENKIPEGSSLLSYNGCYDKTSNKDWYQAEWSFPGTWANNKTGEISYVDKGNDATWHQTKNKFCLPLTIDNTNPTWWYYYMNKKSGIQTSSNKGSYLSIEYQKAHPEVVSQNDAPASSSIEWNIRANTFKFGYFHWNFKINCFYASYAENYCPEANKGKCTSNNPDNFTTRTIAKNDMFPSTSTDDTTGTTDKSQTGRTQGFNWTSAATIDDTKNPYYAVNPEVLISKIQKLGEKVYDEDSEYEYLEYEFRLSPEALKTIKKNNKSTNNGNGNYTNYDTNSFKYDAKKKVYIYTSPLIRGQSYTIKSPAENLLGCNNISKNKCESNLGGNE